MKKIDFRWLIVFTALLLIVVIACSVSFNNGEEESSAEQTLQAIYLQDTVEALAAEAEQAPPEAEGETEAGAAFTEPEHQTMPGNPGSPAQTKNDIDTSKTADEKYALGDSFRLGNLERPFTETDMDYHPETDLTKLSLSKGSDFYYFIIEVYSGSEEGGFPSSSYGIEFDTDLDGRGDVLLWAEGVNSSDWTVENMSVLSDSNNDVGGTQPVVPDGNSGDGYDEVLFSNNKMGDPDAAWQRVEASDKIRLAVKTTLVGGSRFMWKAWADSTVADPTQFDYNDAYSESQAGSSTQNSEYYPVAQLNLMDSTCWIAYNFEPTGYELGGCVTVQPTAVPPTAAPPDDPPDEPPPPCVCPAYCSAIGDEACCVYCGCTWAGTQEFPCF